MTTVPTQRLSDEAMVRFLSGLIDKVRATKVDETFPVPLHLAHAQRPPRPSSSPHSDDPPRRAATSASR